MPDLGNYAYLFVGGADRLRGTRSGGTEDDTAVVKIHFEGRWPGDERPQQPGIGTAARCHVILPRPRVSVLERTLRTGSSWQEWPTHLSDQSYRHVESRAFNYSEPYTAAVMPAMRAWMSLHRIKRAHQRAGLTIGNFMIPGPYIAFSDTHFTLLPDSAPVTEFMRYKLNEDGSLKLDITVLRMPDYEFVRKMSFQCQIGSGARFWRQEK